jgi:hypothetical protein
MEWVQAWVCDQPPPNTKFKVLRAEYILKDSWDRNYNLRIIHEIKVVG